MSNDKHVPTDQSAPELLPCPFCGKSAKLIKGKRGHFYAECQWCEVSTTNWRPDADMARSDWNRRADLAAPSALDDWREIEQGYQPRLSEGYTAVRVSKPGFWLVKGDGPATAQAAPSAPAEVDDGRPMNTDVFLGKLFEACEDHWERCEAINEWLHGDWPAALEYLEGEA